MERERRIIVLASDGFIQIPTRINTYAYSFYARGIRAWNLPSNKRIGLPSIDTFQHITRAHDIRLEPREDVVYLHYPADTINCHTPVVSHVNPP